MTTITTSTTNVPAHKAAALDASRVAQIAQSIRNAVSPFISANDTKVEAAGALQTASQAETSQRELIMATLADLAAQGGWTTNEVSAAAASAAAMSNNDSAKALATFIGETKRAMHPAVREHVAALTSLRDQCWEVETMLRTADKTVPAPLRKAFVRKYHMLLRMFGEAEDGRVLSSADEVYALAAANDPDIDPARTLKRLEAISKDLASIFASFPVAAITSCVEYLEEIDKKGLVQARARKLGVPVATVVPVASGVAATVVPVAPAVPTATTAPTAIAAAFSRAAEKAGIASTVVPSGSEPAPGAIDIDELLDRAA